MKTDAAGLTQNAADSQKTIANAEQQHKLLKTQIALISQQTTADKKQNKKSFEKKSASVVTNSHIRHNNIGSILSINFCVSLVCKSITYFYIYKKNTMC